jgi:hypothetical protein
MEQAVAALFELGGGGSDGLDRVKLEFQAGLGDRDVSRPFGGTKAGLGSLAQRPETEVLCAFKLSRKDIFPLFALER